MERRKRKHDVGTWSEHNNVIIKKKRTKEPAQNIGLTGLQYSQVLGIPGSYLDQMGVIPDPKMLNFSFSHKMTQPELDRRQHVEEVSVRKDVSLALDIDRRDDDCPDMKSSSLESQRLPCSWTSRSPPRLRDKAAWRTPPPPEV